MTLQDDYAERVYAGVLGKLIGVYVGRPIEGWTYAKIMDRLGPITYYVHDRVGQQLVVTDDDVSGTFTFPRALEDYGISPDLSAEDIGRAWLNYLVEERAVLWWGGAGNSTEHTAWLNLARGIPAPRSGSIEINGAAVAEQIGAQIFIDGWALVSPGKPEQAAKLARAAGSVSHDGESVHAAVLWAAMEAAAFDSADIDNLLDIGLSFIPADCQIARLVADIRRWVAEDRDWQKTRQRIDDHYGDHLYPGDCHIVPNHALMIMALLYAPDDFQRGQMIVNTSGWDTDCNAGNLGCLHGIMLGLDGLEAGPDWRGPVADRMFAVTADGGSVVTDAANIALWLTNLGRQLDGQAPLPAPKDGAQFHFSLPGAVQGFRPQISERAIEDCRVEGTGDGLAISYAALAPHREAAALTPVFATSDVLAAPGYNFLASPRLHPGQRLSAQVMADAANAGAVEARLRLHHYANDDALVVTDQPEPKRLEPGAEATLEWTVPDLGGQPIAEVGIVLTAPENRASGRVVLDRLGWEGQPDCTLRRPDGGQVWLRSWVSTADVFTGRFPRDFRVCQNHGEGMVLHGGRSWSDYSVETDVTLNMGQNGGIVLRAQGQRRFYAVRLTRDGRMQIVRRRDEDEDILADTAFPVAFDTPVRVKATVSGTVIDARCGDTHLTADDDAFADGALGLIVCEGAVSAGPIRVRPA